MPTVHCSPPPRIPPTNAVEDPEKRRKRSRWPIFETPTARDLDQIAKVRGLGLPGLELAVSRGILWIVPHYYGHRCWVITDSARMAAQARRLDGMKFQTATGSRKAMTLSGSIGSWPVGISALTDAHRAVLLTEGGPDLLAAHHFVACEGREADAAAVCMLGASCRLPLRLLGRFAARRVRIAEHADAPGKECASRWARQLAPHASGIDGIHLGGLRQFNGAMLKDLNDLVRIHPDDFDRYSFVRSIVPGQRAASTTHHDHDER